VTNGLKKSGVQLIEDSVFFVFHPEELQTSHKVAGLLKGIRSLGLPQQPGMTNVLRVAKENDLFSDVFGMVADSFQPLGYDHEI
jgi:hypothetical protein